MEKLQNFAENAEILQRILSNLNSQNLAAKIYEIVGNCFIMNVLNRMYLFNSMYFSINSIGSTIVTPGFEMPEKCNCAA